MSFDVVALGELLIDFTPVGRCASGGAVYEQNPGGAPANVLAAVCKLGGSGAFIGKVGADAFGDFLKSTLEACRIESRGLRFSSDAGTTLAFVHLDAGGNRSFSFYRKPGADTQLAMDEVDWSLIDGARVFHFGSLSLTNEPSRSATLNAVQYAKKRGKIVSYDPNWRPPLWASEQAARKGMEEGLALCDLVKISEEELVFLTGERELARGAGKLLDRGIQVVLATLGPEGCFFMSKAGSGHVPAHRVEVIDTTGAGDAFMGGFLYQLCRSGKTLGELSGRELGMMAKFSTAVGSLCATKKGAIYAMPSLEEVQRLL